MLLAPDPAVRVRGGRLRRAASLAVSAALHGAILAWVALGPRPAIPPRPKSLYDEYIFPNKDKIVWFHLRERLPEVAPAKKSTDPRPPKAEVKIEQEIVSQAEQAKPSRQTIWLPEPQPVEQPEIPSPNVVAVAPPQSRPVRPFTAPPDVERTLTAPALPEAPEVRSTPDLKSAPVAAAPARPAPRAFTPPAETPQPRRNVALPSAPELTMAMDLKSSPVAANPALPVRPAPRTFVPPLVAKSGPVAPAPSLPSAPELRAGAPLASAAASVPGAAAPAARPAPLPFNPPPRPAAGAGVARPALPDAPVSVAGNGAGPALTGSPSLAIVGMNPSRTTEIPVPQGSRPGNFSGGPQPRAEGGDGGASDGARLVVPGLLARGGARDDRPTLLARATPTSPQIRAAATRSALGRPAPEGPAMDQAPMATRVANLPDARLEGRTVYTVAIQMPNVTSFSGSWTVWFAEREPLKGAPPDMKLPLPLRKVDPKYVASAAAERVEGVVRLAAVIRRNGRVDSVALLRHLDDRLDLSAAEALGKWEFEPALRNGAAVEVDAVFEIPFHLAPKLVK